MWNWIAENGGSILTGMVLLAVVVAIACKLIRDKRKGGCVSCEGCSGNCHASFGNEHSQQG